MTQRELSRSITTAADPPARAVVGIWSDRTILGHGVAAVLSRAPEPWLLRWLSEQPASVEPRSPARVVVAAWDRPRSWEHLRMQLGSWLATGTAVVLIGDRSPDVVTAMDEFAPRLKWCPPDASAAAVIASVTAAMAGAGLGSPFPLAPTLSDQESRVVQLVAAGWKVSAIARRLHVSPHTVHTYLRRVRRKFADAGTPVASTLELYRAALRWGLIEAGLPGDMDTGVRWLPALESSA